MPKKETRQSFNSVRVLDTGALIRFLPFRREHRATPHTSNKSVRWSRVFR